MSYEPSKVDLAWCAGLFEGEGSFHGYASPTRGRQFRAAISMTDEDSIRSFHKRIGLGYVLGPYKDKSNPQNKPFWRWHSTTFEQTQQLMCCLWPWLGIRRKARATELHKSYVAYTKKTTGRRPLGKAVNDEIRQLRSAGASRESLAQQFGISMKRVISIENYNNRRKAV